MGQSWFSTNVQTNSWSSNSRTVHREIQPDTFGTCSNFQLCPLKPSWRHKADIQNYDKNYDNSGGQKITKKKKFHLENRMWGPQNGY